MTAKTSIRRTNQRNKIKEDKNIMHKLINLDEDLSKCENCNFVIQKIDDKWFTINEGDSKCGK